jgi:nucleoside-diphosphate-sugar epimerase
MTNYWKDRKIMITGSTGFIGSNAVNYFIKLGAKITATVSKQSTDAAIKQKLGVNAANLTLIPVDLLESTNVLGITKGLHTILHFAALDGGMKFKKENSVEIYKKNTAMTNNLLHAAAASRVNTFLLLSSSEIYPVEMKSPLTEDKANEINWEMVNDGYKRAKFESEQEALRIARKSGMKSVIVRPANIYGPGDNFDNTAKIRVIPAMLRSIFLEKKPITIWGDGSQKKSFLYIEDFLEICKTLIDKQVYNLPVNVASKQVITLKALADKIAALTSMNIQVVTDPTRPVQPQQSIPDISLLENNIGPIKETTLDSGLVKTIIYYKNLLGL